MLDKSFSDIDQTIARAEISMTPLIDMVFLLLIFFAVTTNFTKETGIQVDKAKAATSRIINKNLFLISISKEGEYWYSQKRCTVDQILISLKNEKLKNENLNIVMIPDKNGRVEPLISLMDLLRANGITKFSIGTQAVKN